MTLARRFNAGGCRTMRRVPNGTAERRRQTASVVRSRVAGFEPHPSLSGLGPVWVRTPPLKRRAIFILSLRDAITGKPSSGIMTHLIRALEWDHSSRDESVRRCDFPGHRELHPL